MEQAIQDVREGRAERICRIGQWVVWRDGKSVRVEVMA